MKILNVFVEGERIPHACGKKSVLLAHKKIEMGNFLAITRFNALRDSNQSSWLTDFLKGYKFSNTISMSDLISFKYFYSERKMK